MCLLILEDCQHEVSQYERNKETRGNYVTEGLEPSCNVLCKQRI